MAFRNQSGNSDQIQERVPAAMDRKTIARSILGLSKMALSKRTTTAKDRMMRMKPGTRDNRKTTSLTQKGTFGCGVDKSWLPHCEQTSAFRGFEWSLGHSLTLKLRPHWLQKSGSPAVIRSQL